MSVVLVTGSAGLIGSEAVDHFAGLGLDVVGIDNDMRRHFFGDAASTLPNRRLLEARHPARYVHHDTDVRDADAVEAVVRRLGRSLALVVHTAAQPSHDWAARDPRTDFAVNATGTLNLLEAVRRHAPEAPFVFTSTNKVYGDTPNRLPLVELETRWEMDPTHPYVHGIPETMSIDATRHSVFGASKVAADVMVQEYGRYFGMRTACFRGGCLTGPRHAAAELHGFLGYLMRCTVTGTPYSVYGYEGKQVRDNIHAADLVAAFHEFFLAPREAEVYNLGGGRASHCSMREAIALCQEIAGRELDWRYVDRPRVGDHVWWVSDNARFQSHYPAWRVRHDVPAILREIHDANVERWRGDGAPRVASHTAGAA
jgi:CDP-paratose 2-epimerase